MATCPNCGEIVMNGDPYCTHCGTALRWSDEYSQSRSSRRYPLVFLEVPIESFHSILNRFDLRATTISAIKRDIDISKAGNAVVNVGQEFPGSNLNLAFIRKNRYFRSIDSIQYNIMLDKIEGTSFRSDFTNLRNASWFGDAVKRKESETGLKFYDCGGGYDAEYDWLNKRVYEFRNDCRVIAHFIKDSSSYLGFEVDFKNRSLKRNGKSYDRTTPYELASDYDWV